MIEEVNLICPGLIEYKPNKILISKLYKEMKAIASCDPVNSGHFINSYPSTFDYKNALEATVCKAYSGVNKLLNLLPDNNNITRPRITGTGSTVFVLFNSKKDLKNYMDSINKIIKNYWHRETYILM